MGRKKSIEMNKLKMGNQMVGIDNSHLVFRALVENYEEMSGIHTLCQCVLQN